MSIWLHNLTITIRKAQDFKNTHELKLIRTVILKVKNEFKSYF